MKNLTITRPAPGPQQQQFKFAPGARGVKDLDPTRVGRALLTLRKRLGRPLTPEDVVTAARPATSPFHDFFTWDLQTAAQERWHDQAAYLLRHVRIVIQSEDTAPMEIPLLVSYQENGPGIKYDLTSEVVKDDIAWPKVIARIKADLAGHARVLRSLEAISEAPRAAALIERAVVLLERVATQ